MPEQTTQVQLERVVTKMQQMFPLHLQVAAQAVQIDALQEEIVELRKVKVGAAPVVAEAPPPAR